MTIMVKDVPRTRDEEVLEWLHLRASGIPCATIGKRTGTAPGIIVDITNKVMKDDLAFSGEPEGRVRAGYWPTR